MSSESSVNVQVLEAHRIGKAYRQFDSEWGRIASWFGGKRSGSGEARVHQSSKGEPDPNIRWVLEEISFRMQAGEAIGVVGANGAGKSTLLKILSGTSQASTGTLQVRGRISAILELGMGFNPELNAEANARHALGLMGFSATHIDSLLPGLRDFAEIADAWHDPLRTYSSGMQMRVAFAVVTAVRPDVLIVDEALSVGDAYFQHKCIERIRDFRNQGSALLLVSHDPGAITSLCSRALLLDQGRILMDGEPLAVMDFYNALIAEKENRRLTGAVEATTRQRLRSDGLVETESGDRAAAFESISLVDERNAPIEFIQTGQSVRLVANVKVFKDLPRLVFGFMIKDRLGQVIFGTNTYHKQQVLQSVRQGEDLTFDVQWQANLGPGSYSVSVALTSSDTHLVDNFHWRDVALVFQIYNDLSDYFVGTNALPSSISIHAAPPRAALKEGLHEAEPKVPPMESDAHIDEPVSSNLSEHLQALGNRWGAIDAGYKKPERIRCRLCGYEANASSFTEHLSICRFGGGVLRRYECPVCEVIAGDEKIFALRAPELDREYREHYRFFSEADSTASEMRCFFSLNPKKDKRYLNWGAGTWSGAVEQLRSQGWDVWAYDPFVHGHGESPFSYQSWNDLQHQSFDGIFSHNVLEHLLDPVLDLRAMAALLRPGGRMAHATPCWEYLFEYTRFHVFFYRGRSREVLLEQAGLKALHWQADWEAQGAPFLNLVAAKVGDEQAAMSQEDWLAIGANAKSDLRPLSISYAQNREDVVLARALADIDEGFYVDVGAAHPVIDSVTNRFYKQGWWGINIEPDPRHAFKLRNQRVRDINLACAIGDAQGPFWLSQDPSSSSTDLGFAGKRALPWQVSFQGLSETIDHLIATNPKHFSGKDLTIHFMKVDVEGQERAVIKSLDLRRHRPWILVIEATRPHGRDATHHEWEPMLFGAGYQFAWFDGLNRYYLCTEQAHRKAALALQPNVFDNFVPYSEFVATRYWHESVLLHQLRSGIQAAERPRLAYCCPMPPDASGVAYYGASVLSQLARVYEVTVVTQRGSTTDPWVNSVALPVIDFERFAAQAASFDRVLYHLGNSPFHEAMFDQLQLTRGAVVLHDVHLGDYFAYRAKQAGRPETFLRDLALAHGLVALAACHGGSAGTVATKGFSLIPHVLRRATSVVVHSEHAMSVLKEQLHPTGDARAVAWARVLKTRLPRALPDVSRRRQKALKARDYFNIPQHDRLLISLGYLHESKCSEQVLSLFASLCDEHPGRSIHLRFVGAMVQADSSWSEAFCEALNLVKQNYPHCSVEVTGWVDDEAYQQWIDAADIAIQLRKDSRGESSGAALDALAGGLALLVNNHGALAEIHAASIADTQASMLQTLSRWLSNDGSLQQAQEQSIAYVNQWHQPLDVACCYAQAIEQAHRSADPVLDEAILPQQTLWVDVSALALEDLGTGIQRVVRATVIQWLKNVEHQWRIELVRLDAYSLKYARRLTERWIGLDDGVLGDEEAALPSPGDVVLFLDLATDVIVRHKDFLAALSDAGIGIQAVVYDLLPISHPQWFPQDAVASFRDWAATIAEHGQALHCISRATASEVRSRLQTQAKVHWFHLGSDIEASIPSTEDVDAVTRLLAGWDHRATVCMVSTVEPRKGHRQVLDAMDRLWACGSDIRLVVIGKPGWMVDELIDRLRHHPRQGNDLYWFEAASDALLEAVYQRSQLFVMASEGEGFGLPIVEAARYGVALLLRDIPVFREIAEGYAMWFDRDEELADAIEHAIDAVTRGIAPDSSQMPRLTWQECAKSLMDSVNQVRMSQQSA